MKMFIPLFKVDVERREVHGRATEEIKDKSGEVFDYESSKPFFQKWSEEIEKATDGKSLGNVRAMHGKVAAGKLTTINFLDDEKAIDVVAKIVDEQEWQKCQEGVYTGFSVGGDYVNKWKGEDGLRHYTAGPAEISIVDNPCVPTAHFSMVKADGLVEEKEFQTFTVGSLRKGMFGVSRFAEMLQELCWLCCDAGDEAEWEGDNSPVPARLAAWIADGATILQDMTEEEVAEMVAMLPKAPASAAGLEMAAKMLEGILPAPQAPLDALKAVLEEALVKVAPAPAPDPSADDLQKAAQESLEKVIKEKDELQKSLDNATSRIQELEALPQPPKGFTFPVEKGADGGGLGDNDPEKLRKEADALPDGPEKVLALIKLAHMSPMSR